MNCSSMRENVLGYSDFFFIYLNFINILCVIYCIATIYSNNMTAIAYTELLQTPGLRGVTVAVALSPLLS